MMLAKDILQSHSLNNAQKQFIQECGHTVPHLMHAVEELLYISDYAKKYLAQLKTLLEQDDCTAILSFKDYQDSVANISLHLDKTSFMRALRHFRNQNLLRLLLKERARLADIEEILYAWSQCADAIILHALAYSQSQIAIQHGLPKNVKGEKVSIYLLAMGKLGGMELNFSSDIDLIAVYSETGHTDGITSIENQAFFSKVIQHFIYILQQTTEDGFVFRVDLRLRPHGESGPIICSLASIETYYQEQGRDWERYAMVKARIIQHKIMPLSWFERLITPFVYRRYIDFSVIEALRSMKNMIVHEIIKNPMLDDIKRGQGGIREIEFIIQSIQLIRGGRISTLRQPSILSALHEIQSLHLLQHTRTLKSAYLFLRRLENAVQMQNDQQLHVLPKDPLKQAQLTLAMHMEDWQTLSKKLHRYQQKVSKIFQIILGDTQKNQEMKHPLHNELHHLWQGHIEQQMAINFLHHLHYQSPERCYQMLQAFRYSPRCRRLSQASRLRLDKFMQLVLGTLSSKEHCIESDTILLHVLRLLENIVGRSAYLALLTENPHVLDELLYWFRHSAFITNLIVNHPFLLEIFVDNPPSYYPNSLHQLKQLLQQRLQHCTEHETYEEILRQFKLSCYLLAARAEGAGHSDAILIGRFLSHVAQVIITAVAERAKQQLMLRYPHIEEIYAHFSILAYGKLGSAEMNYDSDLDLVFIHRSEGEAQSMITRLTQKILHSLTTRSQSGVLYSVDTRLRPSGSAGLLVTHWDAFKEYQKKQAWTWEHQALLRARMILGNKASRTEWMQLKKEILSLHRNQKQLSKDILEMRLKIQKHHVQNDIKYCSGGLIDIEFLVQFLVLAHPSSAWSYSTNTLSFIHILQEQQIILPKHAKQLKKAYQTYHRALHDALLQEYPAEHLTHAKQVLEIINFYHSAYKS